MRNIGITAFILFCLLSLPASAHKNAWDDNRRDWSPLMHAIYARDTQAALQLIAAGADVNYTTQGRKLLVYDDTHIGELPGDAGSAGSASGNRTTPRVEWRGRVSVMEVAIRRKNVDAVKALLATNRIANPGPYLSMAATDDSVEIIQLLIAHGAQPDQVDEYGYTALMYAASFGSYGVTKYLLKHTTNLEQRRTTDGWNALDLARHNSRRKAHLLQAHGLKPSE